MFGTSLRRAARMQGHRFAFLCQDRSIDWPTLHDRATRLSAGLGRLGIVGGDRLAMLLPNGLVGVELFASTVLSGHVIVPLNFRWRIDELADALADSAAKALVVDDHFRDAGVAAAARAQTSGPRGHVQGLHDRFAGSALFPSEEAADADRREEG